MKKLLLATLTTLSFIAVPVAAEEKPDQGDDYRVEIHTECIMHPVLVKQVEEYDSIHDLTYMKNEFYDGITNKKINLSFETIYLDDEGNRWYFPYDGDKYHKHEGIRMVFEKSYDEE